MLGSYAWGGGGGIIRTHHWYLYCMHERELLFHELTAINSAMASSFFFRPAFLVNFSFESYHAVN